MKIIKKVSIFLVLGLLMLSMVACVNDNNTNNPNKEKTEKGTELDLDDIKVLEALTDYSLKESYYDPAPATYASTNAEELKLKTRIDEKREDEDYENFSSAVKIFANSEASMIIEKMKIAALPNEKMTSLVDYLAGDSETNVTPDMITDLVDGKVWKATTGWSFFDDWDYYEKLQDRADDKSGKSEADQNQDEDNVKRQYRNMAKKIFDIGMTGDEFGRVVIEEVSYAMNDVLSEMAGADFSDKDGDYWDYCKTNLKDYDLLTYLLGFNDLLTESQGRAKSVQLYGYYYDYEKKNYDETTDEEFEKLLKYSHQETYTNEEWLDYVALQRDSYVSSYRYSDDFYENHFYVAHLHSQKLKEEREIEVYNINYHNSTLYTEEMTKGMQRGGFAGQLRMSDWLWCYSGDDETMKEYNEASTLYTENKDTNNAEKAAEGKFKFNEQQLLITNYLLLNMTKTELGCALRYQIYNYSSDMVSRIQNNKKEMTLIQNDISLINTDEDNEYAYILEKGYATDTDEAKEYAIGKLDAFIDQYAKALSAASVDKRAGNAVDEPWESMQDEIETALKPENYTEFDSYIDKKVRQEDLVIKKKWSNGDEIGGEDTTDNGHAECTKEYDTSHNISQFADKYSSILQHASGQSVLNFKKLTNAKYSLNDATSDTYYCPKFYDKANGNTGYVLTSDMLVNGNDYSKFASKTINSGKGYVEGLQEFDSETKTWYLNHAIKLDKDSAKVDEKSSSSSITKNFTYSYVFVGWYIDVDLNYLLEETDIINTDMDLYPGYKAKKVENK